jgi:starch synthase
MEIVHISAECYPMAKAGGLADVVGALPRYQSQAGHVAKVVTPMHRTRFLYENNWEVVHKGSIFPNDQLVDYTIIKEQTNKLGFDLYCVDILGILDREKIYGYDDDAIRFILFQYAVVDWLQHWHHKPDVVHVHDHHAGLIPFFMQSCLSFQSLQSIPTVLTIHNAQYQGVMGWEMARYFPNWNIRKKGLLEWHQQINPLAAAIKCVHRVNTVSHGYLQEIMQAANGLELLFEYEKGKCSGIPNGIDYAVWNPATDPLIDIPYSASDVEPGKKKNQQAIFAELGWTEPLPLFIFIGRLVHEKAADLLRPALEEAYHRFGKRFYSFILGSGDPFIEASIDSMRHEMVGYFNARFEYNETLSHRLYATADFLLMPSRVEPCGLNQLYAMRYGTVPIVRRTGGLQDTVTDYEDWQGYGVCFQHASVNDIVQAIGRSLTLYDDPDALSIARQNMMTINNSWEHRAGEYIDLYHTIIKPL